jgi:hypothetical protein
MTVKRTKSNKNGYVNPYDNFDGTGKFIHLDYENNVIERPISEYPYSFSEHCTWAILGNKREKIDAMVNRGGIYSDHLYLNDTDKYNMACRSVWNNEGQVFDNRRPKDIEKMLQHYYDDNKIKLYKVVKSCNASTGYPLWYFGFYTD